jgi:hypothetical protein
MDMRKNAWIWEVVRFGYGVGLLFWQGDWFGLSTRLPVAASVIGGYLVISLLATIYFSNPAKRGASAN